MPGTPSIFIRVVARSTASWCLSVNMPERAYTSIIGMWFCLLWFCECFGAGRDLEVRVRVTGQHHRGGRAELRQESTCGDHGPAPFRRPCPITAVDTQPIAFTAGAVRHNGGPGLPPTSLDRVSCSAVAGNMQRANRRSAYASPHVEQSLEATAALGIDWTKRLAIWRAVDSYTMGHAHLSPGRDQSEGKSQTTPAGGPRPRHTCWASPTRATSRTSPPSAPRYCSTASTTSSPSRPGSTGSSPASPQMPRRVSWILSSLGCKSLCREYPA